MLVSDVCTDVADSQSATPQPHYPRQTRARRSQPRVQLHPLHLAAIRQPRPAPPAYGSAGVGAGPWFPCAGFVQNADGGIVPSTTRTPAAVATSRSVAASIAGADLQSGDRMSIDPKYVTIATTFGCPSTSTPIGRSHSVHG